MAPPMSKHGKLPDDSGSQESAIPESMSPLKTVSPLEKLPKELIWQVVEYAPEVVLNLRRTCRAMHSHVNEFARSPSMPISLTDILEVTHWKWTNSEGKGTTLSPCLDIEMVVPSRTRSLLRLRLKLSDAPEGFMKRLKRQDSDGKTTLRVRPSDNGFVAHAAYCIGNRLGKYLSLRNYPNMLAIPEVVSLINGSKFTKLHVRHPLADEAVTHLLDMIRAHGVDEVCIFMDESGLSDPKNLLLELSSLVKSLYIHQKIMPEIERTTYFMGLENEEWGPVILEMFSRKMDKLRISNIYQNQYLSQSCRLMLQDRLPELGKPIWFEATIRHFYNRREEKNDHVIQVGRASGDVRDWLRIKHRSRVDEEF